MKIEMFIPRINVVDISTTKEISIASELLWSNARALKEIKAMTSSLESSKIDDILKNPMRASSNASCTSGKFSIYNTRAVSDKIVINFNGEYIFTIGNDYEDMWWCYCKKDGRYIEKNIPTDVVIELLNRVYIDAFEYVDRGW